MLHVRLSTLGFVFICVPMVLFYFGNFYSKGILMNTLSIVTILGFTLSVSQFFTTRINIGLVKSLKMKKVLSIHKFIGYFFISLLLFHPLFIVVPKFFDNTVTPYDAFMRMITTFSSNGVIFGLIAYVSMIILLVTSFFRNSLGLKYTSWRFLHGILTTIFVVFGLLHATSIGKHINMPFEVYYILITTIGLSFYFYNGEKNENGEFFKKRFYGIN